MNNSSEESRELYKRQAERNSLELTKKNKELVEKIQELDLLKAKYEDALNNYQDLSAQVIVIGKESSYLFYLALWETDQKHLKQVVS